jgi:hypothetical protein
MRMLLAAALACTVLVGTACRQADPRVVAANPALAADYRSTRAAWRPLGQWSGRGSQQTGSFVVETGALRLRWKTSNEASMDRGRFRVSLHSAISGRALQTVVDVTSVAAGESYVAADPRMSYLVIESAGVDWTATLEEAAADPQARTIPFRGGPDGHAAR